VLNAVRGAQASQQAVDDLHGCKLSGDKAPRMCHDGDQRHLPQICRLACHVRAADDVEAAAICMQQAQALDKSKPYW